jgi:glycosyltransferase involved in cell wall biosynthesis
VLVLLGINARDPILFHNRQRRYKAFSKNMPPALREGKIGLLGFHPHPWKSVERTRLFYERALNLHFVTERIATTKQCYRKDLDAVIVFSGMKGWGLHPHPSAIMAFVLHGGAVLNTSALRRHLPTLATSDLLIGNCTSDREIVRGICRVPPRFGVLPLPVLSPSFNPGDREFARRALGFKKRDRVIGFVARLVPQKNLHVVLRLLAQVRDALSGGKLYLLVVGEFWSDYPILRYFKGDYRNYIAELAHKLGVADAIRYWPFGITDDQLALCYSAMDVLVHPTHSIDENYGYVPLEAMACGTPVVSTAYGGTKDTVKDNVTGFLVRTWLSRTGIRMDSAALRNCVLELLSNKPLRERMGRAASTHIENHYRFNTCAEILCRHLRAALHSRSMKSRKCHAVNSGAPNPEFGLHLPRGCGDLSSYAFSITKYCSGGLPVLRPNTRLRLAAPTQLCESTNRTILDDPAWPASFVLEDFEQELCTLCCQEVEVRALPLRLRSSARRLLQIGLLECST